ncbi:dephospho-CoA kinase [Mycoplasma flocculare]|uniref:Dephospho-CoA kinase n=1 Tax=Mesomycoplasma flocculare TaxID=2128 RepID=A0AAW9XCC2_MESFC|nr:HAD-IIB family hydrolase [Mesomycoplasma flocculare]MXR56895.1 dephospho-CoA kinase [Mesomycoplasma flocculare]
MVYKIGFFDLDGTLLDTGRGRNAKISKKNQQAVRKLAKNCIIVISTGRKFNSTIAVFGKKILAKFYICQNGAQIFDENFNLIFQTTIKLEIVKKITELAKKLNFGISFNSQVFFTKSIFIKFFRIFFKNFHFVSTTKIFIPKNVRKILIFASCSYKIKKLKYLLEKMFAEHIQISLINKNYGIEITDIHASKGKAAEFIAKFNNISLTHTFHIGDSENDISTKNVVNSLIIMKSASKKVKKNAHFIGYKRKFGVAKAVNNLILSLKSVAIVGSYASGKTTFLKKIEKFGYSVLYTDNFFKNCYLLNGDCFQAIKKIRPDFICKNVVDKEKIRDFMVKNEKNRALIEKAVYGFLENHLTKNHYHFVEIPNLWTKNANFLKFFSKIVWIDTSKEQQLLNIKNKKVKKSVWMKNQALNSNKIKFYDVKISSQKWKKRRFFPKFFHKIFKE